jgi:methylmalonyl-CoA mutase N-terminal domain/subunit
MTMNGAVLPVLAFYIVAAKEQGVAEHQLSGTIQNDILKEYMARGTYVFPPKPSLKIATDIFEFCKKEVPEWNTISISGYHIREAGSTAVQEVAFTLSDGLTYVQAAIDRGLKVDDFAPRLSFFFNAHNNFIEEIAKYRAARRLWAKLMKERYQPKDPKSCLLRFHTQTAGSTLIASQIDTNVVRVALQCLAAALGGSQSIHTNSKDEALGLPTQEAATIALRTQQVIAYESGICELVDPLGGSYIVEELTDKIEKEAMALIETIENKGGVVACIQQGYQQGLIQQAAYQYQKDIEEKKRIIVGQNEYIEKTQKEIPVLKIDERVEKEQVARLKKFKQNRDQKNIEKLKTELISAAKEDKNLLPFILNSVKNHMTLGEVTQALESVYGRYRP